jgi:hypothetical protein
MAAPVTQMTFELTVPGKDAFNGKPFLVAPELSRLADAVIDRHAPRFELLTDFSVDYLWRARGGTRRGEPILADLLKPGGLTLHYSQADFVVVFSANHLVDLGLTALQWEALMFEQLSKAGSNENTGTAELRPYDFAGFNAALEAYGPWREDLKLMASTVWEQPALPLDDQGGR